jgi:competence protein ComEA
MASAPGNFHVTVIGIAALAVVGGIAWFGVGSTESTPQTVEVPLVTTEVGSLTIHVSGEVLNPGLVDVAPGSRLAEALAAAGGVTARADLSRTNLAAVLTDGEHVVVASIDDPQPEGEGATSKVDINVASASELERLPGVGPVLAQRIVAFREDHGPFGVVEDLLDVPGIGEAKLSQMREAIALP